MKEIRICWLPSIEHDENYAHRIHPCGAWRPLSRKSLRDMQVLCDAANQVYGAGSHWIESRTVPGSSEVD